MKVPNIEGERPRKNYKTVIASSIFIRFCFFSNPTKLITELSIWVTLPP